MSKIRVLIVDDSVVIRKILSDVMSEDPDLEIAGTAANGKIGLAKIPQVNPDIITLDIEMPEMNGLETLEEIRKIYPKLPVVMFSTLTARGAEATLDALTLGASDYVTKPANVGKVGEAFDALRKNLVPKLKALVPKGPIAPPPARITPKKKIGTPTLAIPDSQRHKQRVDVVAIGVSTGGPNALAEVLPAFPKDFPVPIVMVQHMPPVFTNNLANRLNEKSLIDISEAKTGDRLLPGKALLAEGGHHMVLKRSGTDVLIATHDDPPENSCRPAVDVLFRSVAETYGANVLAVVMTGMGYDGHLGSERIRETGGTVFVQDEATSVVWGMPGIIVETGLADKVMPLEELAGAIMRRVQLGRGEKLSMATEEAQS